MLFFVRLHVEARKEDQIKGRLTKEAAEKEPVMTSLEEKERDSHDNKDGKLH